MQIIYLDISNKGVIPCIHAKQSEVGRKFLAVISDNGVAYNIPDDSLLSVWYEGDTDSGNYSSIEERLAFQVEGNKVIVELIAQMLLKPGKGELCLSITHGEDGETNTWNIPYEVEYKPGAGSSVATEYYTALTEYAEEIKKYDINQRFFTSIKKALDIEELPYINGNGNRYVTMQYLADNLPTNSTVIVHSGAIVDEGSSEWISDWGNDRTGIAYINKGASANVFSMMLLYATANASKPMFFAGNYSSKGVHWERVLTDTSATMQSDIWMNGNKVSGLAAPTSDSDAATKAYVDSVASGGGGSGEIVDNGITFKKVLTESDDLDDYTDNGIYVYQTASRPQNAPFENAAVVMVFGNDTVGDTQKIQIAFRYGDVGYFKMRPMLGGTGWLNWANTRHNVCFVNDDLHIKYIDCEIGDDSNDGSYKRPFKTLDRFLDYYNTNGGNDARCRIIRAGTYTTSKRVFALGVMHIHTYDATDLLGSDYYKDDKSDIPDKNNVILRFTSALDIVFYGSHYNLTGFRFQFREQVRFETCGLDLDNITFEPIVSEDDGYVVDYTSGGFVRLIDCYITSEYTNTFPHLRLNGCRGLFHNFVSKYKKSGEAVVIARGSNIGFSGKVQFDRSNVLMNISDSTVKLYPEKTTVNGVDHYIHVADGVNGFNIARSILVLPKSNYDDLSNGQLAQVITDGRYSLVIGNKDSANYIGKDYSGF